MNNIKDGRSSGKEKIRDKLGKGFHLGKYNDVEINISIPNFHTFKTIQVDLTCWIKPIDDINAHEFEISQAILKKRIKEFIRNVRIPILQKESIVCIKCGVIDNKLSELKYLSTDIVLYVKQPAEFNKNTVLSLVNPIAHEIIEKFLPDQQTFEITRNLKMEARSKIDV
jgi:hypothetical protein